MYKVGDKVLVEGFIDSAGDLLIKGFKGCNAHDYQVLTLTAQILAVDVPEHPTATIIISGMFYGADPSPMQAFYAWEFDSAYLTASIVEACPGIQNGDWVLRIDPDCILGPALPDRVKRVRSFDGEVCVRCTQPYPMAENNFTHPERGECLVCYSCRTDYPWWLETNGFTRLQS